MPSRPFIATASVFLIVAVGLAAYFQLRLLGPGGRGAVSGISAGSVGNYSQNSHNMTTRILCFGDSLTAGYHPNGDGSFYPYARHLKVLLGPSEVKWAGFSGWTTKQMVEKAGSRGMGGFSALHDGLELLLKAAEYDVVVILAGTNDLGRGYEPEQIMEGLSFLYGLCKNHNVSKVLALQIPDSHFLSRATEARERRDKVSELIRKYDASSSGFLSFVPLSFTWVSNRDLYDRDGLHLNKAGYRRLAEEVAQAIVNYVPKAQA